MTVTTHFVENAKFSQGLQKDNRDNVGRDENLIKFTYVIFV